MQRDVPLVDRREGLRAQLAVAATSTDDELIDLLVPPPRPCWQTALIVLAPAVALTGIVLLSESGAFAPRLDADLAQWGPNKHAFTVVFRVHNNGWTSTQVRAVDASKSMFGATHVLTPLPQTLAPHKTLEVTVRFDSFNCEDDSTNDRSDEIRVRVKNTLGFTITRWVKIVTPGGEQDGWPAETTAHACAAKNG